MKLNDLGAYFVRYETRSDGEYNVRVSTLAEAQGIQFLCPFCFEKNLGRVGTHLIAITFEGRGAKDNQGSSDDAGKPTRWTVEGTGFQDLTLTPSIQVEGGCEWHGFVKNGETT